MTSRTALRPSASLPESGHLKAAEVPQRHAENPSAFLSLNGDTRRFSVPGVDGFIACRPAGRGSLVQLGGAFAHPDDQARILGSFTLMASRHRRSVVAVQLLRADAERYAERGFTVNQFGTSYARSLAGFNLKGSVHMRLRW